MAKMKCPRCWSKEVQVMGNTGKNFSAGKAIGGAVLLGPFGALGGFLGKKGKYEMFCMKCGHRWKTK